MANVIGSWCMCNTRLAICTLLTNVLLICKTNLRSVTLFFVATVAAVVAVPVGWAPSTLFAQCEMRLSVHLFNLPAKHGLQYSLTIPARKIAKLIDCQTNIAMKINMIKYSNKAKHLTLSNTAKYDEREVGKVNSLFCDEKSF